MWRAALAGLASLALCAGTAAAQPVSGPRETVDQTFTTTRPATPTGIGFAAAYHAPGDPRGNPPYMRRMVFYPPSGMRYDTTVPDVCSAPDVELEAMGPDACPPASQIGRGTTEGLFFDPVARDVLLDHYQHNMLVLNGPSEQILLIQSEGYTVVRGRVAPDGSIEFSPPACFPVPPTGQCVEDYVLQLKSTSTLPPYSRTVGGQLRSYATTPSVCPAQGYWQTTIRYWWADGSVDSIVTRQPCARPAVHRRHHRHGRHRRGRHSRRRASQPRQVRRASIGSSAPRPASATSR